MNTTQIKVAEALQALRDGGTDVDMVVNIGEVLSADWTFVREEIRAVAEAVHHGMALVKVIFENCYLQNSHKIALCEICGEAGADFV
jgi:deoxyribose-phosphate aldolase